MRRHAPACERNRAPLLDVLRRELPSQGLLLEIAAGTGQHAAFFSAALPELDWQPTDADPEALASIAAWADSGGPRLRDPLQLDVGEPWPLSQADAVLCVNMIHIAPWQATLYLLAGAARVLPPGGPLVLYGPFRIDGAHTAPSNARFERWLQDRDPRFGVRDLAAVSQAARAEGLVLSAQHPMPANNFSLVFRAQ